MSIRPLIALGLTAAALAACAPTPYPGGVAPGGSPASAAFDPAATAWSQRGGQAAIEGRITYAQDGRTYGCVASAALHPDTPYTRARFQALYGSTERAALPAAVVRARNLPDPAPRYYSYVRETRCENGAFRFSGLPDGGWFLIAPARAGDSTMVLMRRIETRGGRVLNVSL